MTADAGYVLNTLCTHRPDEDICLQWKQIYRVHQKMYSAGFEPPWFSVLGMMDPGKSFVEEFFASDNWFTFILIANLELNCLGDIVRC